MENPFKKNFSFFLKVAHLSRKVGIGVNKVDSLKAEMLVFDAFDVADVHVVPGISKYWSYGALIAQKVASVSVDQLKVRWIL